MKIASDFRRIARTALSGKWWVAVLAGFIAALLGGVESSGPEININFSNSEPTVSLDVGNQTIAPLSLYASIGITIIFVALVIGIALFILGNIINVGYSEFNLQLVDRKDVSIESLFSKFSNWKTIVAAGFLKALYIFLWTLLFIIPGILATYNYAMTGYILAENPEMTASEALERSKEMMYGNRWRLFCLEFSFIGWTLLCLLTCGIGNLWLVPYQQASVAAFYREISGTENSDTAPELLDGESV